MMLAALLQSTSGLFMTDDIFFEAPLYDWVDDSVSALVRDIHTNAWRLVLVAVAVHLAAHVIYGVVLRDPTPLSMVTGKKEVELPAAETPWFRAVVSLGVGVTVFLVLTVLAD